MVFYRNKKLQKVICDDYFVGKKVYPAVGLYGSQHKYDIYPISKFECFFRMTVVVSPTWPNVTLKIESLKDVQEMPEDLDESMERETSVVSS